MKRKALFAAVILAIAATGCTVTYRARGRGTVYYADAYAPPQAVVVTSAPPPPQVIAEARPGKPDPNSLWIDGHWAWQGRWVWLGGHWETTRPGYVWTAPVVVNLNGSYQYHAGYWRPGTQAPPPVYQGRGGVTVVGGGYQGGGTVAVNPPPQPRPGTTTVVVRPPPQPQPQQPVVVVQPPQPRPGTTTVVVRPAPQPQPPTVVVRPGENPRPGVQVGVGVGVRPGTVQPVQPVRPGVGVGVGVGVRPGTVQPTRPGVGVGTGVNVGGGPTLPVRAQLQCSVPGGVVPRGAQLMVQGNGFGADTRVQIGGQFAPIIRSQATQAVVQVPNDSSGGIVAVTSGGQTVNCGSIRTTGAGGR